MDGVSGGALVANVMKTDVDECYTDSSDKWPRSSGLARFCSNAAGIGQILPEFDQIGPTPAKFGPLPNRFGRCCANLVEIVTTFQKKWPNLAHAHAE